jgi:hypothetical protein
MAECESSEAVFKSRAKKLASLLAAGEEGLRLWQPEELAAIFRHQLAAPIMMDLGAFDATAAERLQREGAQRGLLLKSFADLFQHPSPPLELLALIKDFAKANRDHPGSALPPEIAAALYYASIAAALVRLDRRISSLSDFDLHRGLQLTLQQAWLDLATRELLSRALEKVSAGRTEP